MKNSHLLSVAAALVSSSLIACSGYGMDLLRAEVNTTRVTTNATGGLSYKHYGNHQIFAQAAAQAGLTNLSGLRLVYSLSGDDLEVVSGTNNTVIATPFTFSGGVSLSKTNNSVLERLTWVYLGTNTQASGTLHATEFSHFGTSNELTAFALRGQLQFATPAAGTNGAAIYSGSLAAGGFGHSDDDDDEDDHGD
jgi:hypothetical protein